MPLEHFFNEQGLMMQGLGDRTNAQDLSFLYGNPDDLSTIRLPEPTHLTDMSYHDPNDPHDLPFDQWGMPRLENTHDHDTIFVTIEHSRDPQVTTFDPRDLPSTLPTDRANTSFLDRDPYEHLQSQYRVDMDEQLDILQQPLELLLSHDEQLQALQDMTFEQHELPLNPEDRILGIDHFDQFEPPRPLPFGLFAQLEPPRPFPVDQPESAVAHFESLLHELPLYLPLQDSVDMDEQLNNIQRQLLEPLSSHDELSLLPQDITPQTRELQKIQWTNPPTTRRRRPNAMPPNATPEQKRHWNNQRWQRMTPEQKERMYRQRQVHQQQMDPEVKKKKQKIRLQKQQDRYADTKNRRAFITEYFGVPSLPASRESITSTLRKAKEAYAKDSEAIADGRKKHFEQLTPESLRRKALRWAEDSETFHNTSSEDEGE